MYLVTKPASVMEMWRLITPSLVLMSFHSFWGMRHTREWARQSQMTLAYHSKGFFFWVGGRAQTHTSPFLLALWPRCFLQLSCTVLTRVPQEIWGLAWQWQTSLLLAFHWWGSPWLPSGRSGLGKVVRVDVGEQLARLCRILRSLCNPYSTVRTQEPRVGFFKFPSPVLSAVPDNRVWIP